VIDNAEKERIVELVRWSTGQEVMRIMCPACGGPLKVQVSERAKKSLSVMCRSCLWRVINDGIAEQPPWVETLGRKIETGPNPDAASPAGGST